MADAVLALFPQAVFASAKCRVADGAAAVDITGFAAQDNAVKERAALSSVVNTLLELPDIHAVSVTFDGERQKALPHGTAVWEAFQEPLDVLPAPTITPSPLP